MVDRDRPARPLPDSLYARTARAAVETSVLDTDASTSVAIVGGGFTGLSAALHLAERGVECRVLEAHEPGWGASGRNGGQVNPGLKANPSEIVRLFGPELGPRMVALGWGAPQRLFDLIRRYAIDCDAQQAGSLRLAFAAPFDAQIRATVHDEQSFGHPVQLLDAGQCRQRTGASGRYRCGMLDPRGGSVNPLGLARGLAEHALRAGAKIHRGTPALSVWRENARWIIQTPLARVKSEKLIIATNGYTDSLWPGLQRSVIPAYTGIVASEPLSDALAANVLPAKHVVYEIGSLTSYYRIDSGNRLLMGGVDRQREQSGVREFKGLRAYTERLWPALRGIRWEYGWNGKACLTTDHFPHIHEPAAGVLACLGYNGRGVALACSMGEEIACRIVGSHEASFSMPITPIKELPFHWFTRLAVPLRIEYGKIRDGLARQH